MESDLHVTTIYIAMATLLLSQPNMAAMTGSVSPTSNVMLIATPEEIQKDYTSRLTLTCFFNNQPTATSNFSSVMSIILSKSTYSGGENGTASGVPTELAAISSATPDKVTVKDSLGATTVSGRLTSNGNGSYLSFEWAYPTNDVQGVYSCDIYGMDNVGHPKSDSAEVEIGEKPIDFAAILDKIKETDLALNGVKQELAGVKSQLNSVKWELDGVNTQLEKAWAATFITSANYQNHQYFLSRPAAWDEAVSESVCEAYGGHLVEVNDEAEWDFVLEMLNNNSVQHYTVIGVTDLQTEGAWTYVSSGLLATYLDWAPGQPNNFAKEDCVYVSFDTIDRKMHDGFCNQDGIQHYICEIE